VLEPTRSSSELEPFGVEVKLRDHVTIVQPHGELDIATVERLRATLDSAIAEIQRVARDDMERPARLVLDLRGLSFCDSTGLHLLVVLDQRAKRDGFELALLAPAPPIDSVIHLSGLDQLLPFVAPDDAATANPATP
jgi:anti-sigma B factor antagonist